MTSLGEQLGLGSPAENDRIDHDLTVLRRNGITALRHQLDGEPIAADLYLAALARLDYGDLISRHPRRGWADLEREIEHDEQKQTSRGGNR